MMADSVALLLFRTTLCTTLAAALAGLLLRRMRYRSPRLQRVASILVLLQGWMFFPIVLELAAGETVPIQHHENKEPLGVRSTIVEPSLVARLSTMASASNAAIKVHERRAALVWIAGAAIGVLWLVGQYLLLLCRLPLGRRPREEMWLEEWARVASQSGVSRSTQFRMTDDVGPLSCYLPFFYLILCPERLWRVLNASQREAILTHETAHIQRGDLWKSILVRVLALPQWFNPLAWRAVHDFDEAAEWACDDRVMQVSGTASQAAYPSALLQVAESTSWPFAASAAARGSKLATRIRRMVCAPVTEEKIMSKILIPSLLVGFAIVQSVRICTVAARETEEPGERNRIQASIQEPALEAAQPSRVVRFSGNHAITTARLEELTGRRVPASRDGEVDRDEVLSKATPIRRLYREIGYFKVRVAVEMTFGDNREMTGVEYKIWEGPRYRILDVRILLPLNAKPFPISEPARGDYFDKSTLDRTEARLSREYPPPMKVKIGQVFKESEPHTINLRFEISKEDDTASTLK